MSQMNRDPRTHSSPRPAICFKPVTGRVELELAEALEGSQTRPHRVTSLLSGVLETIDGKKASKHLVRSLATGIRDFLVIKIVAKRLGKPQWFSARCPSCETPFDFEVDFANWPFKSPGKGFPVIEVTLGKNRVAFETPNGFFEEKIADRNLPEPQAVEALANLCALEKEFRVEKLGKRDKARIDKALEKVSPECAREVSAKCPECGATSKPVIDPLPLAFKPSEAIFREVHLIASHYHWPEKEILALSGPRRARYIGLIESAGLTAISAGRAA